MASAAGDRATLEVRQRGLLMFAIMCISIVQLLDATIANVALPHMQTGLGASADTVTWVLTSFIIATAVATPITGWLSDRVGSRNLFIGSIAVFLLASALCGASVSLPEMVAFRILQGIAAAFIGPMAQTVIFDINPPSKQAGALSVWSMVLMVGPISGPIIGSWLTETLNWRWIYYINLPIGIPALLVIWKLLPSRPVVVRKLDVLGFWTLGLGLGVLQLMLDRGEGEDWFSSTEIVIEAIVAVSLLWVFLVHTRLTRTPLFSSELMRNRNFVAGMICMGVLGLANVAMGAMLPSMFQNVYQYPVMLAGMLAAPRGVGVMLMMMATSRLIRKADLRYVITAGFAITAYGQWMMCNWSLDMDWHPIAWTGFVQGLGLGLIVTPVNLLSFSTLPPTLRPDGSSLLALTRNLGGSFGITLIVITLSRNSQISHADLGTHVTADMVPGIDLPAVVDRAQPAGSAVMQMIDGAVSLQAAMIAYLDSFYMMFWVLLLATPLPLFLRKSGQHQPAGVPIHAE